MQHPGWALLATICAAQVACAPAPLPAGSGPEAAGVTITPIYHASVQLAHGDIVIHVDPWSRGDFSAARPADLILITDTPSDHLDVEAIRMLRKPGAPVLIPSAALEVVPDGIVIENGETLMVAGVSVEAIPMYDLIPGDPFHPKGAGNGYIVTLGGQRIYLAGVTECVPEIRALSRIDVAFIPFNLPHGRMTPLAAADCVRIFQPRVVYPYHYREGNVEEFRAALAGEDIEVRLGGWYPTGSN